MAKRTRDVSVVRAGARCQMTDEREMIVLLSVLCADWPSRACGVYKPGSCLQSEGRVR